MKIKVVLRTWTIFLVISYVRCNDLNSLIEGLMPNEEIKLDGEIIEPTSDKITLDRSDDGKLSVSAKGKVELSVSRSTGLPSGVAQELIDIIGKSIGNRYQLINSIKRGGRYLTLKDNNRFNEIINSTQQDIEIYINDKPIDLNKASLLSSEYGTTILEPVESQGIKITLSNEDVTVKTDKEGDIKIVLSRGLNKQQIKKLKNNFYEIIAEKVSIITGLPKPVIEISLAGRNTMVDRLTQILKPVEEVMIDGTIVDIDKNKGKNSSEGTIIEPENFPKVKIIWTKDGNLRVDNEDNSSVSIDYSKGVEQRLIEKLVDGLHKAVVQRLGMISWSNKFLGSLPNNLVSTLNELQTKLQKRTIYVNDKEINLNLASVIETNDDTVLYRLTDGVKIRITYDGAINTEDGDKLSVEVTPGVSETQAANILNKINQISSTAFGFSTDSGETLMNDESNRMTVQSLIRGIKVDEKITIDDKSVDFIKDKISKTESDYTEYNVEDMEDVILTKFTNGDIKASGKDRKILMSRSTGLSLDFLNRLVKAINNVLPRRKRWFYDFGLKDEKTHGRRKLQELIDEIPSLIQNQTIEINDKELDLAKASIISSNDLSTVYTPETNSKVQIIKYINGDIEVKTDGGETISVKLSPGITAKDAETLTKNIQKIVGDKIKIKPNKGNSTSCFSGDISNLMEILLNGIGPLKSMFFDNLDLSATKTSSATRSLKDKNQKDWSITNFNGRGKVFTTNKSGNLNISLSTGLTQDLLKELMEYLTTLLENKEDVIKMVTGSFPEHEIKKLKEMVHDMVQDKTIKIDSKKYKNNSSITPQDFTDVIVRNSSDGIIQVESASNHNISVTISPGLTQGQAEQLYKNIMKAFRLKFAEITYIPIEVIDFLTGFKKYFIKSYFYSAAPPKELIFINGVEIPMINSSLKESEEFKMENQLNGVDVSKNNDGDLEISFVGHRNISVIRTTGLSDQQIERILNGVEYVLGIKNKMLPILSDELYSHPNDRISFERVVRSYVLSPQILINGKLVDLNRTEGLVINDNCKLYRPILDLSISHCNNGEISVEYGGRENIILRVLSGISEKQANHIISSLQSTINKKCSNIKILANFPDTFFQLLAEGKIKSLEKLLMVLIPREELEVDGHRIPLEPLELNEEKEKQVIEPKMYPGVKIIRYLNGTLDVTTQNGGKINIITNTGVSHKLIKLMLLTFKDQTTENIKPYLTIADKIINSDTKTIFNIVDGMIRQQIDSGMDINYLADLLMEAIQNKLHTLKSEQNFVETLATTIVQKQQVYINNKLVNLDDTKKIDINEDYITYSPKDKSYVKITQYNNGRLIIDSQIEETISARVTGGIPPKLLASLLATIQRFAQRIENDKEYVTKIKEQITYYVKTLSHIATQGIEKRRRILIDDYEIQINNNSILNNSNGTTLYKVNETLITIDEFRGINIEIKSHKKLYLDYNSGLESKPVIEYLRNNSENLLKELIQSYKYLDSMAPLTTKVEKILNNMYESVKQTVYINDKPIEQFKIIESNKEFKTFLNEDQIKVKHYRNGTIIIVQDEPKHLNIFTTNGLPVSDLDQLSLNLESIFSRFNPIELMADFFDILPKNFFLLAQNMDRVLSILNIIKF